MELFDTHAHLNAGQFDEILPDVIQRASDAGVTRVTVVGCTAEDSQTAIDIAEQYNAVFASVGIQPNYVSEANEGDYEKIVELAKHPRVIAIGETGLDRYWDRAPFELQQEYFAKHIELSQCWAKKRAGRGSQVLTLNSRFQLENHLSFTCVNVATTSLNLLKNSLAKHP